MSTRHIVRGLAIRGDPDMPCMSDSSHAEIRFHLVLKDDPSWRPARAIVEDLGFAILKVSEISYITIHPAHRIPCDRAGPTPSAFRSMPALS